MMHSRTLSGWIISNSHVNNDGTTHEVKALTGKLTVIVLRMQHHTPLLASYDNSIVCCKMTVSSL